MKFTETEAQFRQLKAQYDAGDLSETDFKARLQVLMIQDEDGRWWMIGPETGQWYVHDGQQWVRAEPPVPQGQPTATTAPPETPAVTWTKPEESVPGSQAQPPRPWLRIGAGIVATAVVIVVTAQLAGRCQPTQRASPTASPTMTASPAPTPIHTAMATMVPTATLTPLVPLFFDDFGNAASGWPDNYSDQYCERGYEGGEYHILSKTEGIIVASYPRSFDNFALEVDARELGGLDGGTYGVLLRQEPTTNYQAISRYYYVWVDPVRGAFGVQKWQGAWTVLETATASASIQRGTGTNHIRVECVGPQIVVYMNNVQVASVTDNDFAAGWIGLSAAGNGMHAHFDNVQVWAVEPGIYDRVQPTPTPTRIPAPAAQQGTIKIGLQGPMTGDYAEEGKGFQNAIQLWVDQANAAGGINGQKFQLIAEDDKGAPREASLFTDRLV